MSAAPSRHIHDLLRDLGPEVLGRVARRFHDFSASEDAVQEALIAAANQWPVEGVPDNPRAWLLHVAVRRLTDHVRAEAARRRRETIVVSLVPPEDQLVLAPDEHAHVAEDDALSLLFMCCHPSLSTASAIALTLRALGGLTTLEIANAFFVPEATMAQRISRAKQAIKASAIPFELPNESASARAARLGAAMHVLYLIFNEGYTASVGTELQRVDLSTEAIRLMRTLHALMPENAEVSGLLALMVLTDARRAARSGSSGELIPLDEQDRLLWDRDAIAEGVAIVTQALAKGAIGPYQVQAAIAAIHDEAASIETTDWPQVLALYGVLETMIDSPMIALNRAVALAMVEGPEAGLAAVEVAARDPRLHDHYRVDAVRGHLFERARDHAAAAEHYARAAERTTSVPEQNYLLFKASRVARGV